MKKLISLLSILFVLTLIMPPKQAEAYRGSGGHGDYSGPGGHGGYSGHEGFLPGLIISGVLGWDLWPYYYYPPEYYYYPPPAYYYPPPAEGNQVPPSASQGAGGKLFIYPRQGQSEEKKAEDFNKCHTWAVGQTGFDPSKPPVGTPDAQTIQKESLINDHHPRLHYN